MNKLLLILTLVTGVAISSQAQALGQSGKTGQSKPAGNPLPAPGYGHPDRAADPAGRRDVSRDVTLEPGSLQKVVEQLDAIYSGGSRGKAPANHGMPNLVWTPDVMELPVPAPLRLSDVTAVDALALVAAAAGCTLEPVTSPHPEEKPRRVIGFKFVQQGAGHEGMSGGFGMGMDPLGSPLKTAPGVPQGAGMGAVKVVGMGDPFGTPPAGSFPGASLPGIPGGMPAASPTGTAAGGTSKATLRSLKEELARAEQTFSNQHPRITELKREIAIAERASNQMLVTRVYAMGGILTGSREEQNRKLEQINESIHLMVDSEGRSQKDVQVNFHEGTGVLIARAPEAVQELITQLMEALRENAKGVKSK